jgi:ATP-dependent RNA helicase RhlE
LQRAGIAADSIHGDKSQQERLKALEAFKEGSVLVLVATDVAARGLDIDELPHVINFELPRTPEDYIHRIGRTGRAGKPGTAISLVSASEVQYLVEIEKLIRIQVEQVAIPGFEPEYDYTYPPGDKRAHHRRPAAAAGSGRARRHPAAGEQHRVEPPRAARRRAKARPARAAADARHTSPPTVSTSASLTRVARNRIQVAAAVGSERRESIGSAVNTRTRPRRPVAALLGGLGRK